MTMDNKDAAICRIDRMKWVDMQQVHNLVSSVRAYANTHIEVEDHIRQVAEQLEDTFEGRIGPNEYAAIVKMLKGLVEFVRTHRFEENDHQVIVTTGDIIKLVQGDNKMNKNKLQAMTFRRVQEAIQEVAWRPVTPTNEVVDTVAEAYAAKIVSDVFGGKVPTSAEYVDKYYEMDPESEDLLDNGSLVIDGMKVLIEDPDFRQNIYDGMTALEISNARMTNRWATVEKAKLLGDRLSFVGVYDDGIKRKVVREIALAWLVKKDSIPRIDTLMNLDGVLLDEMPTAKMVAYLKDRMKVAMHFDVKQLKIQTGYDGDIIPMEQYLVDEGIVAVQGEEDNYEVFNEEGNSCFFGSIEEVCTWARGLADYGDAKYAGFEVTHSTQADTTLEEFMQQHGGTQ